MNISTARHRETYSVLTSFSRAVPHKKHLEKALSCILCSYSMKFPKTTNIRLPAGVTTAIRSYNANVNPKKTDGGHGDVRRLDDILSPHTGSTSKSERRSHREKSIAQRMAACNTVVAGKRAVTKTWPIQLCLDAPVQTSCEWPP